MKIRLLVMALCGMTLSFAQTPAAPALQPPPEAGAADAE